MQVIRNPILGFRLREDGVAVIELLGETGEGVEVEFSRSRDLRGVSYGLERVAEMLECSQELGVCAAATRFGLTIDGPEIDEVDNSDELWDELLGGGSGET